MKHTEWSCKELQQAVQQQQLINTTVMQFQIMVSREWGGRHKFRTREFYPNESMETAGVRPQGLKRQPKSTTEELEDGDQDDADADMKMLGAVREEPVITIGLDRETLAECEVDEESFIDDVNGGGRGSWIQIWSGMHDRKEFAWHREMQVYCPSR